MNEKTTAAEILARAKAQTPPKPTPAPVAEPPVELPPLLDAACKGDVERIRHEVARGVNIETTSDSGNTAICYALLRERHVAARALLELGANPNPPLTSIPPLTRAASMGDQSTIVALLDAGADVNARALHHGLTALMLAKDESTVHLLIEHGASVEIADDSGQDAVAYHRFQASAIRRNEEQRKAYYERVRDVTENDKELQSQLMKGLEEMSRVSIAERHEAIVELVESLR